MTILYFLLFVDFTHIGVTLFSRKHKINEFTSLFLLFRDVTQNTIYSQEFSCVKSEGKQNVLGLPCHVASCVHTLRHTRKFQKSDVHPFILFLDSYKELWWGFGQKWSGREGRWHQEGALCCVRGHSPKTTEKSQDLKLKFKIQILKGEKCCTVKQYSDGEFIQSCLMGRKDSWRAPSCEGCLECSCCSFIPALSTTRPHDLAIVLPKAWDCARFIIYSALNRPHRSHGPSQLKGPHKGHLVLIHLQNIHCLTPPPPCCFYMLMATAMDRETWLAQADNPVAYLPKSRTARMKGSPTVCTEERHSTQYLTFPSGGWGGGFHPQTIGLK